MKKSILFSLISISLSLTGQSTLKNFKGEKVDCKYHLNQDRLNGLYTSYYKNGKKKAEGEFENNLRVGTWKLWDYSGKVSVQREYINPFSFKNKSIAKNKKSNSTPYNLSYNDDKYITYFEVDEKIIVLHERYWRYISKNKNPLLFENDRLFKCLEKNILAENIKKYTADNDEFLKEDKTKHNLKDLEIIGYNVKEDYFFDNKRFVSETRIIGICPVAFNKQTKETTDLYWLYFPETRKYVAQEKIQSNEIPEKIKSLDDLFFFRYFSGEIYKKSNVLIKNLSEYKTSKEIAEKIEIKKIENEHNLWFYFAEGKK